MKMPAKPLFDKSILLHLRIPFSFFLMPVFVFALSQSTNPDWTKTFWAFLILHVLVYPASNAYNSYFDRDEGPIGSLEKPPPVDERLFYWAWVLDLTATLLGWLLCGWVFALAIIIYSSISKAYSNDRIRLKRFAIASWLTVGIFQGAFTYLSVYQAINQTSIAELWQVKHLFPAVLTSLNLLGFYPMTQIYQHDEDARRGDHTMSLLLGIRGTFLFTATIFLFASAGFVLFFYGQYAQWLMLSMVYLLILAPTLSFFMVWFFRTLKDATQANFRNTMMLNLLGSICLNLFFGVLWLGKDYFETLL